MAKQINGSFGVDIDAMAGWLGSYGGEDSPSDIQRGVFGGEVGTPRRRGSKRGYTWSVVKPG